jgi:hypothetical protein
MGSSLYYGPVPNEDELFSPYQQYNQPQYGQQQYNQQQYSQRPSSVTNSQVHSYAPAGPPAPAAEGVIDEESGGAVNATPPEAAAAAATGRGSRVSFSTDVTDSHSHAQSRQQQGGNGGAAQHPTAAAAAAFNPGAYAGPIRKAFGSFTGVGGLLLRRNTSNMETPRLNYSPAADPDNAVFCDYETAGVYDPARWVYMG